MVTPPLSHAAARATWIQPSAADTAARTWAVVWAVVLLVPWIPDAFLVQPRDGGYTIFSHIAFVEGAPWGAGTLHTGGPLGFLRFPVYYAPTYPLLVAGNAFIAATAALMIDTYVRPALCRWARLLFVTAAIAVLAMGNEALWLLVLLLTAASMPDVHRSRRWSPWPDRAWFVWPILLALTACALAANAKGTLLLMATVVAAEIAVLELWGRRLPLVCAAFIAGVALVGLAAGMRIADWGPYVRHIAESVGGYAQSFALAGTGKRPALLIASTLAMLGIIVVGALRDPNRSRPLIRALFVAVLIGVVAKAALVRQDESHELRAFAALGVLFACHAARRARQWGRGTKLVAALPAAGFAILLAVTGTPLAFLHDLREFADFVRSGTHGSVERDRLSRDEAAAKVPRPWPPGSSVAAFGSYQSLLLGHPGRRVAMPFVASYEIWSPWSSRREREFLMGSAAPEYLVYTASPASAEVAIALTARYDEIERERRYRLWRRREQPLQIAREVRYAGEFAAAQRLDLDQRWGNQTLVAEVHYTPRLLTRVISSLYQPPQAFLVLFKGSEPYAKVRMNALLSGEGIVLSSAPGAWDGRAPALHGIRHGLLTDAPVEATAIGFEADGPMGAGWERYFQPRVTVRLHTIGFEAERRPGGAP